MNDEKISRPTHEFISQLKSRDKERRSRKTAMAKATATPGAKRNDLNPKLVIVERPPGDLKAPTRTLRKINNAHIRDIVASIQTLGFCAPILISEDGEVIDGVGRLEAAKLADLRVVPCIVVSHLSADERRILRLAVNRLGEKGEWSLDELKVEFEELRLLDAPITISGFAPDEIDQLLVLDDNDEIERVQLEADADATAVACIGDMFQLGDHLIICGDATDEAVLERMMTTHGVTRSVRMIFTDQPYNVPIAGNVTRSGHREFLMGSGEMTSEEFRAFNLKWTTCALLYLCEGGVFGTFIDWRGYPVVHDVAVARGLTALNLAVWVKTNAGLGSLYRSQHELLPLFKKGVAPHVNNIELGRRGRWRSNVWTYAGASSLGSDARRGLQHHPTVKPAEMLKDALMDLTNRGDVVLDPFLGSGSTLIAAQRTRRICRGVELDPRYVDVTIRRFEAETGQKARLATTGQTFVELAAMRLHPGP